MLCVGKRSFEQDVFISVRIPKGGYVFMNTLRARLIATFLIVAVVAVGVQGAPGPPGRDANEVAGALVEANRLSEYAGKPEAQQEVQQNIGLGVVDPLAYYILAKS